MSGASRSQGPETPRNIEGSALQAQLQDEGVPLKDGLEIIRHVMAYRTPGHIMKVVWRKEDSLLQHQYLLVCIMFPETMQCSWIRIERMGDIDGSKDVQEKDTDVTVRFAPSMNGLGHHNDKNIETIHFEKELENAGAGPGYPTLVDLANFIDIISQEQPGYTLLHYNCWWLARQLFKLLVSGFLPNSERKRSLLWICSWRKLEHVETPYHSPWRGRAFRSGLFLVTFPIAHIAWPAIIVGSLAIAGYGNYMLKQVETQISRKIRVYMDRDRTFLGYKGTSISERLITSTSPQ